MFDLNAPYGGSNHIRFKGLDRAVLSARRAPLSDFQSHAKPTGSACKALFQSRSMGAPRTPNSAPPVVHDGSGGIIVLKVP